MYSVEVTDRGGYLFNIRSGEYEFTVDAKASGEGITPPDTLLAALGSCIGVYIRKYAEGARLEIEGFKVTVKSDFCKEGPVSFKSIEVSIDMKDTGLDERRRKALLEFIKNCPVHNTLAGNPKIDIRIGKV